MQHSSDEESRSAPIPDESPEMLAFSTFILNAAAEHHHRLVLFNCICHPRSPQRRTHNTTDSPSRTGPDNGRAPRAVAGHRKGVTSPRKEGRIQPTGPAAQWRSNVQSTSTCRVRVFRNLILKLQHEVGDRCFGHPYPKRPVVLGINYVSIVNLALR